MGERYGSGDLVMGGVIITLGFFILIGYLATLRFKRKQNETKDS